MKKERGIENEQVTTQQFNLTVLLVRSHSGISGFIAEPTYILSPFQKQFKTFL